MTESLQNKSEINEDALQKLMRMSCIFRTILKKEGLKLAYNSWKKRLKNDVENVMHNMLCEKEIASYLEIHKAECENLEASGIHCFEVLGMDLDFLGARMVKRRHGLACEYKKPVDALLATVAASNNQTVRTPWEVLCYGETGEIVEGMSSLEVPERYVTPMTRTRNQVVRLLEGVETLDKMVKVLAPHIKGIIQIYPAFDIDWHWLKHHAKEVLANQAHDSILAKFPAVGVADISEKQVLVLLQAFSEKQVLKVELSKKGERQQLCCFRFHIPNRFYRF